MEAERYRSTGDPDTPLDDAHDALTFPDLTASNPFGDRSDDDRTPRSAPANPTGYASAGIGPAVSINGSSGDDRSDTDSVDKEEPWRVTRLAYGRHIRMLLVESETADAADFERAAAESVLDVRIETVPSTEAAKARLERSLGSRPRRPAPDVVVVSLPMPEAHRLLELLYDDTRFDGLPLIVLAKDSTPEAERRSFALGAAAHLASPRQDYERVALIHALPDFIPSARAAHAHLESHRR